MKDNDQQIGRPVAQYTGTKANIEALPHRVGVAIYHIWAHAGKLILIQ